MELKGSRVAGLLHETRATIPEPQTTIFDFHMSKEKEGIWIKQV